MNLLDRELKCGEIHSPLGLSLLTPKVIPIEFFERKQMEWVDLRIDYEVLLKR
jgi:hypothetical protein